MIERAAHKHATQFLSGPVRFLIRQDRDDKSVKKIMEIFKGGCISFLRSWDQEDSTALLLSNDCGWIFHIWCREHSLDSTCTCTLGWCRRPPEGTWHQNGCTSVDHGVWDWWWWQVWPKACLDACRGLAPKWGSHQSRRRINQVKTARVSWRAMWIWERSG